MYKYIRNSSLAFFSAILLFGSAYAQKYEPYHWEEKRGLTQLDDSEKEYGLYYILVSIRYQYLYDPQDNQLVCYATNHNIIRTNNDEALSKSNRVYIPMGNTIELVELKARAITKDNGVTNFDQVNLKELESDESGYKILAIEGAEVGGEIEYFYTRKINASNFNTHTFQFGFPVKTFDYSLKSPENLEYEFKVYNWDAQVTQTDTTDQYNLYELKTQSIPAIFQEDFSAYENHEARLEVKLAYNNTRGNIRLFTWGDAGKRIYDNIYTLTKEEQKAVNKLIKDMKLTGDPINSLKMAENYIKSNYFLEPEAGDAGEQIDMILKNKYATSRGFTRLFAAMLGSQSIEHEIVLTSNRFQKALDPDFDTWNYLNDYLIYIPSINRFLSPKDTPFRLGTVPFGYYGTYGLFIRQEPIQDFIYPVAHIGYIPESPYSSNIDDMDIEVNFSENMEKNQVKLIRSFKGYSASYYKIGLLQLEEDTKKEMLDEIIKYLALDAEIKNIEVLHANTNYDVWEEPFVVKGTFNTNSYIESAGDVILFKAGELIGPQSELYQDHERKLEVVNSFNRGYERKIVVHIPEGYTVQNPGDLMIKEQVFDEDKKLIYNFESKYELNGQKLEVEIDEFYDQLTYPVEKFEAFRRVINSAADFNKIVLVLSK
jgi:hypothetical protein